MTTQDLKPDYLSGDGEDEARRWTIGTNLDLWRYSTGRWAIAVTTEEYISEERGLALASALERARDAEVVK